MEIDYLIRWGIVVVGIVDSQLLMGVAYTYKHAPPGLSPNRGGTRLLLVGAAVLCLFLGLGTLGVILKFDSTIRLPFILCALCYIAVGCILEIVIMTKRRRNAAE